MTDDDAPQQPGRAQPWLDAIKSAEKAFETYQDKCDNIAKQYAHLEAMASTTGDREMQIFWANLEVLRPSMYQRPPQPVVMPRHTDSGEVPRKAAEMLERALQFDIEFDLVHEVMLQVRDDLALCGRGVPWVLDNGSVIHVDRRDFLHEPARKWSEVGWVARRAYITKDEGRERFGDAFKTAEVAEIGKDRDDDYQSTNKKAQVWEIWSRTEGKVVWVVEGVETTLEESEPLFDVKGFFPCPKPAFATLEPGTLLPVPDFVYYRDQVDEINELTARISSLSESLRMKGFYSAGTSEVGEAIETAMKQTDNRAILVPISNLAALGGSNLKDSIVWLPVREVAEVVQQLVLLRQQLIEDVYQITGLSDIMRGVTEAQETLGAQNLKAQFGSIRVREKQNELIRIARDVLNIKGEIYSETLPIQDLMAMAGMQLPTQQQAQQIVMQAQQRGAPPPQVVTVEQVTQLLQSQRMRPFTLEIETDSTITPNEQLEKEMRVEFLQAMGQFMGQALPLVQAYPQATELVGELMRFGAGAFRANRDMGSVIDDFIQTTQGGAQDETDPAQQAEMQKVQIEAQKAQAEMQLKQAELQLRQQELQMKAGEVQAKAQQSASDAETKRFVAQMDAAVKRHKMLLDAEQLGLKVSDQRLKESQAELQALLDIEELELERTQARPVALGRT